MKAIPDNQNNPNLFTSLANAYERKDVKRAPEVLPGPNAPADGMQALKDLTKKYPNNINALKALGQYARNRGRLSEAVETYRRISEKSPGDPSALTAVAEILEEQKDYAGAERAYRDLAKQQQWSPMPRIRLGEIYEKQNRFIEARAEFEQASRMSQNDPVVQKALQRLVLPKGAQPYTPPPPAYRAPIGQFARGLEAPRIAPSPYRDPVAGLNPPRLM